MRKHEILKGVAKLVVMLTSNIIATFCYSNIDYLWYFEYDFWIRSTIKRIFKLVYISSSKLGFDHIIQTVLAFRYSFVGKSRFVKEIFQIYLHIQTCHVYHFLNCPIHMFMFSSWQRISAHENIVYNVVAIIVCMSILFCRTCYLQRNCMKYE